MKKIYVLGIAYFLTLNVAAAPAFADIDPMGGGGVSLPRLNRLVLKYRRYRWQAKNISSMKYQLDKKLSVALQANSEKK